MSGRYPKAIWAPWTYIATAPAGKEGLPCYYRGQNHPEAVVIHSMQGWASTAVSWAKQGFFKSWHFTVAFDGTVYQHLEFEDGGYHAGITDSQAAAHRPTWPLWKGPGLNINRYTLGVEHEGVAYVPYGKITDDPQKVAFSREAQRKASKELLQWCASELGIPYDHTHFPWHAEIDLVNRADDPLPPTARLGLQNYLFGTGEEDDMTPDEVKAIAAEVARAEIAKYAAGVVDDDVDDRLRSVEANRFRLINLAADLDAARVENAVEALRKAGFQF